MRPLLPALQASLVLLLATLPAPAATSAGWPQWRGPGRDGQFAGPAWPDRLDTNHLRRTWHVELGPSYSGPVVDATRVYTTETRDKAVEVVTALDRRDGKVVWQARWEGAISVPFFAKSNGDWIRATPALDGDRLYVAGMRDVLVCLDATSGTERWRRDFPKELGTPPPDFGLVCSPLVDGDAIYLQAGGGLTKVDKLTGRVLWQALKDGGGMMGGAFSSPLLAELAGRRQLVVQTREKLAGVDPRDGSVLWEQPVESFRGMNILTPVVQGDMVFTSTYGGKTLGFRVTRDGDRLGIAEAWRHKAQGYMTTPVVVDGVAYTHLRSQRAMAIEVTTGRELWTTDVAYGKYWNMVAQGERILALDQRGLLLLLRANREKFDLLDQRQLTSVETWAHLAAADDQLFVRELKALSAYRWTQPGR